MPPDEVIDYKTIVKNAGTVTDKKTHKVTIGAEVKYKKKFGSGNFVKIENVGGPYLNIPGVSAASFEGGSYNVEKTDNYARISRTGSLKYKVNWGFGYEVGLNDIVAVSGSIGSKLTISTKTQTFDITINKRDF